MTKIVAYHIDGIFLTRYTANVADIIIDKIYCLAICYAVKNHAMPFQSAKIMAISSQAISTSFLALRDIFISILKGKYFDFSRHVLDVI